MDGHPWPAARRVRTELGLQAASLAPHPIPRTNQPLVSLPAEGLHSILHTFGAFHASSVSAPALRFAGPSETPYTDEGRARRPPITPGFSSQVRSTVLRLRRFNVDEGMKGWGLDLPLILQCQARTQGQASAVGAPERWPRVDTLRGPLDDRGFPKLRVTQLQAHLSRVPEWRLTAVADLTFYRLR